MSKDSQYDIKNNEKVSTLDRYILLFEIFTNVQNKIATSIDLSRGDFTDFTGINEVILLPMFTFQVTNIRHELN